MTGTVVSRLAYRALQRRVLQSILFVLSILAGVALVVGVDVAADSARRAFSLSLASLQGDATHEIVGGPSGVPSALYRSLRADLGIRTAAPVIQGTVRVGSDEIPLTLLGIDPFAEAQVRQYLAGASAPGVDGQVLLRLITEPDTVLVSQSVAARLGVEAGEQLELRTARGRRSVTLVGIIHPANELSAQALASLVVADISTAQEIVGSPGVLTRIDLVLTNTPVLSDIQGSLPPGVVARPVESNQSNLEQLSDSFTLNLQALSLLALIVGLFLVYSIMSFSVVQRRRQIGMLRAIGATRRQVFAGILLEAVALGVAGTLLGLAVGYVLGGFLVGAVTRTISDLYYRVEVQALTLSSFTIAKGVFTGLGASLGAALIPALNATGITPASTLRSTDAEHVSRSRADMAAVAGIVVLAAGLVLTQFQAQSLLLGFGALFLALMGSVLITPLALLIVMRLVQPVLGRAIGTLGRTAPRAIARSLSRTGVAVAALSLSVSVIVGVSVMIASFRGTVTTWLDGALTADVFISAPASGLLETVNLDPELAVQLQNLPGVSKVLTARDVPVLAPDYPDLPPVNLVAVSDDLAERSRRYLWLAVPKEDVWDAMQNGAIIVTESFAYRRGITSEANTLRILTDNCPRSFPIVGVYYHYGTDQGIVLMSDAVYRKHFADPWVSSFALFLTPEAQSAQVVENARRLLADQGLSVQSTGELRTQVFTIFDRAFNITAALRSLAAVVAFIGVLSALMAIQIDQQRTLGTMRALGLTSGQLWRLALLETGLMGLAAGVFALPIGLLLAKMLINVINVRAFGWTFSFLVAPGSMLQAVLIALTAALLAGAYPAWRVAHLAPAEAIRYE
ncbi:MAG: FtsX-like permease family protein [Chloroflexota bacterium]|nr:FtsX-like permease family protein [Chloroflexota bacterium]